MTEAIRPRDLGVASLNALIGLPCRYARQAFACIEDASFYFFDYNYVDRKRLSSCLEDLERARRARQLDFAGKTLLLSASGLDPHHAALLAFARQFADRSVFFELWNTEREVITLQEARLANLFFLPVTASLRLAHTATRQKPKANARVFVSLGGDDDLVLLREVIARSPELHFFVPDHAWDKFDGGRREFRVDLPGRNVTSVACSPTRGGFTLNYHLAYLLCDTVLVATQKEKQDQMRGGIRIADALAARKRLVIARNPMCELLMAQHEKTCLVAAHDATDLSLALERAVFGRVRYDEALYEEIRSLTRAEAKFDWMMRAAQSPAWARASPFHRDESHLAQESERVSLRQAGESRSSLFELSDGQTIEAGDLTAKVARIRRVSPARFRFVLTRADAGPFEVELSTAPVDLFYRRTRHGHFLSYRGRDLTTAAASLLDEVASFL